jgi:hypothetical protein
MLVRQSDRMVENNEMKDKMDRTNSMSLEKRNAYRVLVGG